MSKTKERAFLNDLSALLEKHNASLELVDYDGADLYFNLTKDEESIVLGSVYTGTKIIDAKAVREL